MNVRRKARETALQVLYKIDIAEGGSPEAFGPDMEGLAPGTEARSYCELLVNGVVGHGKEIDSVIEARSENWTLERMAVVDRNILRLSVFELLYTDTPYKVIIDEAVELAKRFGSEESSSFINGVIDRIRKEADRAAGTAG